MNKCNDCKYYGKVRAVSCHGGYHKLGCVYEKYSEFNGQLLERGSIDDNFDGLCTNFIQKVIKIEVSKKQKQWWKWWVK